MEPMKHLKRTLETHVNGHYNMCNIPIYFCNIDIQHLQHTKHLKHTLATVVFALLLSYDATQSGGTTDSGNLRPGHHHRSRCWGSRPYPISYASLLETVAEGGSGPDAMEKERGRPIGRRS
jgi:hypothetical protein